VEVLVSISKLKPVFSAACNIDFISEKFASWCVQTVAKLVSSSIGLFLRNIVPVSNNF
jgi:hypothetical protein